MQNMENRKELISKFKKNNKERREAVAKKLGFGSAKHFLEFLSGERDDKPDTASTTNLHVYDVLDTSSSMDGNKLKLSLKGIREAYIKLLEEEKKGTKIFYNIVSFGSYVNVVVSINSLEELDNCLEDIVAKGTTALYDAIYYTIEQSKRKISKNPGKALINIYTDGQDNNSVKSPSFIKNELKKSKESGIVTTFVGTPSDVEKIIKLLGIERDNTLSYNGSASGLSNTISKTIQAREKFSSNMRAGLDVSTGFYKQFITKK